MKNLKAVPNNTDLNKAALFRSRLVQTYCVAIACYKLYFLPYEKPTQLGLFTKLHYHDFCRLSGEVVRVIRCLEELFSFYIVMTTNLAAQFPLPEAGISRITLQYLRKLRNVQIFISKFCFLPL